MNIFFLYLCINKNIFLEIEINGEVYSLCGEKCMIRNSDKTLYIADLHFGKSNHFRRSGIAVPNSVIFEEIQLFVNLLKKYDPSTVVFLGDLFHSSYNKSVDLFHQVLDNEVDRRFVLVEGNHDVMRNEIYLGLGLEIFPYIKENGILWTHEPKEEVGFYNIYGHLHPGVNLVAGANQRLRLPCFFFSEKYAVMPAYGIFTGLATMKPQEKDKVYVIGDGKVIEIK